MYITAEAEAVALPWHASFSSRTQELKLHSVSQHNHGLFCSNIAQYLLKKSYRHQKHILCHKHFKRSWSFEACAGLQSFLLLKIPHFRLRLWTGTTFSRWSDAFLVSDFLLLACLPDWRGCEHCDIHGPVPLDNKTLIEDRCSPWHPEWKNLTWQHDSEHNGFDKRATAPIGNYTAAPG